MTRICDTTKALQRRLFGAPGFQSQEQNRIRLQPTVSYHAQNTICWYLGIHYAFAPSTLVQALRRRSSRIS